MASAGLEFVTNDYDRDRFVRTGRVALIKRADNGRWALPGGYAEVGSPPSDSALRELREETGRTSSTAAWAKPTRRQRPQDRGSEVYICCFRARITGRGARICGVPVTAARLW